MGMSLPWAEFISTWSNWILVAALIVGVLATYGIVVSGNVKEAALKGAVASAGERAAAANERAAKLEKEAADARLEQEKLKAQLAWRTVTPELEVKLLPQLHGKRGELNVQYLYGDPEAQAFAIQLANLFSKAGWKVHGKGLTFPGNVLFGVWIPGPETAATSFLRNLFVGTGFPTTIDPLPATGLTVGDDIPGAPILFVGAKPQSQ